jgi:hypothetical protein
MACTHTNIDCGCKDSFLTSPAPCPTPEGCPDPQPCSEVFDAQCIIYTGDDIVCNQTTVVAQDTNVASALNDIVDTFCTAITIADDIDCNQDTVVTAGTLVGEAIADVVDYFCNNSGGSISEVAAGDNVTVTETTVGNTTTYTVNAACPICVDIVRISQDPAYFQATVTGGTAPYIYSWSFADTLNSNSTASMYVLVPHPTDANKTWYADNPAVSSVFDACSSANTGRAGLLKVKVTDANGCSAKDTHLILKVGCE